MKQKNFRWHLFPAIILLVVACSPEKSSTQHKQPNIIVINADDLGYGDLSCYGATSIKTPNIDSLASRGLRFTRAYTTSATCTPSRFSMLTGTYAWRRQGTGIARGNAGLIIPTDIKTLPAMLENAGYNTGVVGKWHLGLGPAEGPDWNGEIKPGPLEVGFGYNFLIPATGDRVPCVYVENRRVVDLDPSDPIQVSYEGKIGDEPTGHENPELLKVKYSHGHDNTIVNGISRIGFMTGGKSARWIDEDMADVITNRAVNFIEQNKERPFFLYFATQDIHVPRAPHSRFAGKSGMGPRGDVILQLDWCVGEIMKALRERNLAENTIVVFTSDNGPVIDDGYEDMAVQQLGGHTPSGVLRGGKYSAFEAGTRVPFIVAWPGQVIPGVSGAIVSQIDLFASFAALTHQELKPEDASDSFDHLSAFLGKSTTGREYVIQQSLGNTLSVVHGDWKYIEPSKGARVSAHSKIELGNDPEKQLYNLAQDAGETDNVALAHPDKVSALEAHLAMVREGRYNRP